MGGTEIRIVREENVEDWGSNEWLLAPILATSAVVMTADILFVMPFWVPKSRTVNAWEVNITSGGSANSVIRAAIVKDSNSDGVPDALVADLGTVLGTGTGVIRGTPTAFFLPRGRYYLGAAGQGSPATQPTVSFGVPGGSTRQPGGSASTPTSATWRLQSSGHAGAFPASLTFVPVVGGGGAPRIAIRSA